MFVAPGGNGELCSCTTPCALETGRNKIRSLIAGANRDLIVQLADGNYRLTRTLELGSADSGPGSGKSIIYRAAPSAKPMIVGALKVQGFAPKTGGIWVAKVPAGTAARQLWVGGRRATRARSDNLGAEWGLKADKSGFTLGNSAVAGYGDRMNLEIVSLWLWKMFRCPVAQVSVASGIIPMEPCWTNLKTQVAALGVPISLAWIENSLSLLDTPGEFYLDSPSGQLFYMPRKGEDLANLDVELPVLDKLVNIQGTNDAPVHDVAFEGISFGYSTWLGSSDPSGYVSIQSSVISRGSPPADDKPPGAVTVKAGHRIRFSSSTFTHLGATGLLWDNGTQSSLVDACRFDDISAGAIMMGGLVVSEHQTDSPLAVKNNQITNSYITKVGQDYYDAPGIYGGVSAGLTIAENELFDLPYTGITVGGGCVPTLAQNNEIRNNLVHYHMRKLKDGGGIYVTGQQNGSKMRSNFVTNQGNPYGNLYVDNCSTGWTVSDNLVLVYPIYNVEPSNLPWLHLQTVYGPVQNITVENNFTNRLEMLGADKIPPSNILRNNRLLTGDLSPAQGIINGAGSPLRSPEIAAGKSASASSIFSGDAVHGPAAAIDNNGFTGWSPEGGALLSWWQVDLGRDYDIDAIEVVTRGEIDQPESRRNFQVKIKNSAGIQKVVGQVDDTGLPLGGILAIDLSPVVRGRYVMIEKTVAEYLYLSEVRVHGK